LLITGVVTHRSFLVFIVPSCRRVVVVY